MIICSNCSTPNAEDHRFCSTCGHALTVICPNCGTQNEGANKFCFNCGTALRHDGSSSDPAPVSGSAQVPTVAQRRLVSVLFADLVGYTTFSEGRDAEDVRAMLTDYYDRCRTIVARYGGRTDKFIGDAVMGVWGAVAAHEDDAERATRAALEIVDMVAGLGTELGIPELAARAGVLSGEASVGPGGNEQGLVVGDLVNTASRLQSISPPGGVVVGAPTRELVGGAIEFVPLGERQVKGKSVPVDAWQAMRVVASSAVTRRGELGEGPFVGREDELRILKDQLHAVGRERQARLVSVVGEAGIGKTRLSDELLRYIEGVTEVFYHHKGRSPSYGAGVAFWALGEMVRQRAAIVENEDAAKSRLKLRTAVAEFAPDEDDQRWIEARLAGLIGLAPMPHDERPELFAALRSFFLRVADRGTTVMVFEDLHWADAGLLDFIEELIERTTRHPILVLTLARSDLLDRRPDWGSGRQRTLSMHLGRLDEATITHLVTGLAPGIDEEVATHIASRTAGVPLHAVEFVRMLLNDGRLVAQDGGYRLEGDVDDITIPDSVSAVIGARLDRLGADESGVIQDASVLGYSFSLGDLALMRSIDSTALEPVLRDLTRREILELDEDPRSPERGQYRFVQSLIREVAYSRLSRSDRVRLHLQVAAQFEAAGDVEAAGIVASHYTDAAASDPGDRELADRARHAIVAAAERAVSLHSHDQAITLYDRAIDLAVSDVDKAHLQLDLADAFAQAGRYADGVDIARRALEVFEEVGDPQGVVIAATTAAAHLCTSFRADEAADLIVPVYERTPRSSDAVWANLASQTSRALMLATRSPESVEIVDSALPVMEALDLTEEIVETAINKGTALFNMGRWVEGTVILRGAADLAQRRDMTRAAMRAINNLATMAAADNRRDRSFTDEMERMLPRLGDLGWQVRTTVDAVQFNLDFGEFEEMRERLARARELSAATETNEYLEVERLRLECVVSSAEEAPTDELLRFIEPFMSTADPQLRSFAHLTKAEALLFAGRFGEVIPLVDSPLADPYPEVFDPGLVAGAWTADVEGLSHMEEVVADRFSRGRACRTLGLFIGATRAALVGDREAAVALFEEADELGREVTPPRQLALMNVAIARAAGLDHPLGHRAGSAAAGFFEEAGFRIYLELFADALPLRSEDSATAAG